MFFAMAVVFLAVRGMAERNDRHTVSKEATDAKFGMILNMLENMNEQMAELRREVKSQHQLQNRLATNQGIQQHEVDNGQPVRGKGAVQERQAAQQDVQQHEVARDGTGLGAYPTKLIEGGQNKLPLAYWVVQQCMKRGTAESADTVLGNTCMSECLSRGVTTTQLAGITTQELEALQCTEREQPCYQDGLVPYTMNGHIDAEKPTLGPTTERCAANSQCCFVHQGGDFLSLCDASGHGTCKTYSSSASAQEEVKYAHVPQYICTNANAASCGR